VICSWPKLTTLNLSDCLLRPRGGVSIATVLQNGSNPLLTSLKLQSNELDHRAINILASAITQHLPLLVDLELNGNRGEAEDDCYVGIGTALEKWDHADALDELDEMEEMEDDDEDEEDEEEAEDEENKGEATPVAAKESVADSAESDELAALIGKVHIA
jgi:Ran GTPase-activating protein 1